VRNIAVTQNERRAIVEWGNPKIVDDFCVRHFSLKATTGFPLRDGAALIQRTAKVRKSQATRSIKQPLSTFPDRAKRCASALARRFRATA
jgi:hypothetical protein